MINLQAEMYRFSLGTSVSLILSGHLISECGWVLHFLYAIIALQVPSR